MKSSTCHGCCRRTPPPYPGPLTSRPPSPRDPNHPDPPSLLLVMHSLHDTSPRAARHRRLYRALAFYFSDYRTDTQKTREASNEEIDVVSCWRASAHKSSENPMKSLPHHSVCPERIAKRTNSFDAGDDSHSGLKDTPNADADISSGSTKRLRCLSERNTQESNNGGSGSEPDAVENDFTFILKQVAVSSRSFSYAKMWFHCFHCQYKTQAKTALIKHMKANHEDMYDVHKAVDVKEGDSGGDNTKVMKMSTYERLYCRPSARTKTLSRSSTREKHKTGLIVFSKVSQLLTQ